MLLATGQALYALNVAGKMAVTDSVYQKASMISREPRRPMGRGMCRRARYGCSRTLKAAFLTAEISSSQPPEPRGRLWRWHQRPSRRG
jgi:hypothetical protein